jgi:hypothetical protein
MTDMRDKIAKIIWDHGLHDAHQAAAQAIIDALGRRDTMTAYTNKKTRETVTLTQKEADRFFDNRDPNEWEVAMI